MWMKYTRVTSVSATVLHKHKYLTALAVTPSDRVIAAAQELAKYIKGRMTHHLIYTILDHKERLGTILKQHMPQTDATSTTLSPPQSPHTIPLRRSPCITTTVTTYGQITATPAPPSSGPINPPILPPRRPHKVFISRPQYLGRVPCPTTQGQGIPLMFPLLSPTA